jgi:hypothetical protein
MLCVLLEIILYLYDCHFISWHQRRVFILKINPDFHNSFAVPSNHRYQDSTVVAPLHLPQQTDITRHVAVHKDNDCTLYHVAMGFGTKPLNTRI